MKDLRSHIYQRLNSQMIDVDESVAASQRASIKFRNNKLYEHGKFILHYTSYDTLRCYETINPTSTKPDVMFYEGGTGDPIIFQYARVLGVYHVIIQEDGGDGRRFDFLHVRWLRTIENASDFKQERIGFVQDSEKPYGFLDPADVIRAIHLIPAFAYGVLPSPTYSEIANIHPKRSQVNYMSYYVSR